nr:F-box protein At3g07870-like [Ipomoea trifida]GMD40759.1 F-box protein At3g07870-like [Ipomoea batatas]
MMALLGLKRRANDFTTNDRKRNCNRVNEPQDIEREGMVGEITFEILKLPFEIICNILSRLPLKTIICCRSVCKKFLKILKDPYFANVHLARAPSTTASLILQSYGGNKGFYFYTIDLDETSHAISDSTGPHKFPSPCRSHHELTKQNAEFCFQSRHVTFVGSCNGLLCLYSSLPKPFYYVCNPILGESVVLPPPTPLVPDSTYYLSGFGFCPKTKQYKVVRFLCSVSVNHVTNSVSKEMAAEIYTLGSDSWRRIGKAPCPKRGGSFDPFVNGSLHWIIETTKTSEQICSFDLNTEQFRTLPSPLHFDANYIKKVSWINIGTLGGHLCLCYIYDDACLEVWVMKDYGVKESWSREFSIDIKFYCGLKVENLRQPVKFLNNGDLWLMCSSNSLASYNPRKGTFRDFKALAKWKSEVIALVPSFVSLNDAMSSKNLRVESLSRRIPKIYC